MKILNNKQVSGRRPEVSNRWRWNSYQELKQVTEASVPTPTEADVVHLFQSATDNKLKIKKTGGTIINLEDIGSGTWSNTSTETFSNKTINVDTSSLKHSSTNSVGDILRSDGTKYVRLAKGTANQVLATNAAGTDLEWQTPAAGGGGGESNTASSVGSAGIGLFYQKVGVDLQFKKIFSPDGTVNISDDTANQKIDFTLPAGVAKTQAPNTYGDFQQTFRSSRLAITNPANSFAYFFVGSALTASRNVVLPVLTQNDQFTFDAFSTTLTNKTLGTGTVANTDTITLKHSTTNLAGELLVNTGTKYDRFARGSANSILRVNPSGTAIEWASAGAAGGVKLPDGNMAPSTGRWGAFFGGGGNGMGMMGFAHQYARLHGSTNSSSESVTIIYTAASTNAIAEFKTAAGFRRDSTCVFKAKWALNSAAGGKVKIGLSDATSLPAGGTGSQTTRYDVSQNSSSHSEFDGGVTRQAIRFDAGAPGLGEAVTEVVVRFRKYGTPSGNATVNVRRGSDDGVASQIGTFSPNSFGSGEQSVTVSNLGNSYTMVSGDRVSVEFPSDPSDGLELDESDAASPSGFTSQYYTGSWGSAGTTIAMQIKCSAGGGASGNTPLNGASGLMVHGTIGTHSNYRVARNSGNSIQTEEDSTKPLANMFTHTVEFQLNTTNCIVIIDGTTFTYTTTVPATTTSMAFWMHIESDTSVERGLRIAYAQVVVTS